MEKLGRKHRPIFPYHNPPCIASPIVNIFHLRGTFVRTDESTLTHHYHPESTVHSKVHFHCCIFHHEDKCIKACTHHYRTKAASLPRNPNMTFSSSYFSQFICYFHKTWKSERELISAPHIWATASPGLVKAGTVMYLWAYKGKICAWS